VVLCTSNFALDPATVPLTITSPEEFIRSASLPEVSTVNVSAAGNLMDVFVSPVWTILSAISTSPVKVPVEALKGPLKLVAVMIPLVASIVIAVPTLIPDAVTIPA
jgi:hypothetical protein